MNTIRILDELRLGGTWLGAARSWMQSNVREGDTLTWGSNKQVSIEFSKFEEFALCVAVAAVSNERDKALNSKPKFYPHQLEILEKLRSQEVDASNFDFSIVYTDKTVTMRQRRLTTGNGRSQSTSNCFEVSEEQFEQALNRIGFFRKEG